MAKRESWLYVATDEHSECVVTESQQANAIYVATVLHWVTVGDNREFKTETFSSNVSKDHARQQAEHWIKSNLLSDWTRQPIANTDH